MVQLLFFLSSCSSSDNFSVASEIPEVYWGEYVLIKDGSEKLTILSQSIQFEDSDGNEYNYDCEGRIQKKNSSNNDDYQATIKVVPKNPDIESQYFHFSLKKENNHLLLIEYVPTGIDNGTGSFDYEYLKIK